MNLQLLQELFYLGRYHAPVGIWLVFWPSMWGLIMACQGMPRASDVFLFLLGSLLIRGAGCTANDILDVKFDQNISRTAQRPLAVGSVTVRAAWTFLVLQLLGALIVLLQLPAKVFYLGFIGLAFLTTYPFMKRWTYWPQLYLGFAMNLGLLFAFVARSDTLRPAVFIMYALGILWTLTYDTIYAVQDEKEDRLIGVKSTVVLLGQNSYYLVAICQGLILLLLAWVSVLEKLSPAVIFSLLFIGAHFLWQLSLMRKSPKNARIIFLASHWVGAFIAFGLLCGYR